MKNKLKLILMLIIPLFFVTSCGTAETSSNGSKDEDEVKEEYVMKEVEGATNLVKITMESGDEMVIELYPEIAPITVNNFQWLVKEGFYEGITFHRVIEDFVIQAGDPTATGMGGSDENIKGEFSANGVKNNLSHTRGVISMARNGYDMNSASSQFFICHQDQPGLDGSYAAFGKVIEGLDTLDKIAKVETDSNDKPLKDQVIKSITFVEE